MSYTPIVNSQRIVTNSNKNITINNVSTKTSLFRITGNVILNSLYFFHKVGTAIVNSTNSISLVSNQFQILTLDGIALTSGTQLNNSLTAGSPANANMGFNSAQQGHTFNLSYRVNSGGNSVANPTVTIISNPITALRGIVGNAAPFAGDLISTANDRDAISLFSIPMTNNGNPNYYLGINALGAGATSYSANYDIVAIYTSLGGDLLAT